ncbi:hypothetical protein Ndes2526B_g07789 [Nannochloris sp. 'desiccata']|nr:hypothetical protein NADE_006982 [Chlorella desiccata (nom. nud.)]
MLYLVHTHPDDGIGHRVGFEGYTGTQIENTIPAVRALAAADAAGEYTSDRIPAVHFPFIEFDVRETKDGELVLFHDIGLKLAFALDDELEEEENFRSGGGGGDDKGSDTIINVNSKPLRDLAEQGIDWHTASVEDLTLEQLLTLHLGGREGQHVPTLKEFLEACVESGVRRSLAVEIKSIKTDPARLKCLELLTWYLDTYGKLLDKDPLACKVQYKPLGWAGIIAFPHLFCESFGEFGSVEWRTWAAEMKKRGISARCVHFHYLNFTTGA